MTVIFSHRLLFLKADAILVVCLEIVFFQPRYDVRIQAVDGGIAASDQRRQTVGYQSTAQPTTKGIRDVKEQTYERGQKRERGKFCTESLIS